ncbi:hypothetical protein [Micromonospora sp. NPDC049662]|uniref:hypothetical protein n=1 Tax=Micromonospora sp. NPDC049662 TaxID=3155397 RepID=UPI003419D11F
MPTLNQPRGTDYNDAARQVADLLAHDADGIAAAGAVQLAIEAWKSLAGTDLAWDRFGLELLDIRARLYSDHDDVVVDAESPTHDDAETRRVVAVLLEQLARHHDRLAADHHDDLASRDLHTAAAQQLRRAVATLV